MSVDKNGGQQQLGMKVQSRAPGRICLYGEHQDYMGHQVIAAAIDLAIFIDGSVESGNQVELYLQDFDQKVCFSMTDIVYADGKDYLKSAVNLLLKRKIIKPCGIQAQIRGTIPIQAGTSSSSALVVAWLAFLIRAAATEPELYLKPDMLGELAYLAEVIEFNESGGRMDQYASAFGGIVAIDFFEGTTACPLPISMHEFVLGDSLQTKPTQKTLKRVRGGQEEGLKNLQLIYPFVHSSELDFEKISPFLERIPSAVRPYLVAVIKNKDITKMAKAELSMAQPRQDILADLMNQHQRVLRDDLLLSTPLLNNMIDAALSAGAMAAKINGSGEGGCMFAYCPGRQEDVAEAIARVGGRPYVIQIGHGANAQTITDESL